MRRPRHPLRGPACIPLAVAALLLLAACGGGDSGGSGGCTPGEAGCACDAQGACAGDLACAAGGTCVARVCTAGTEGCPCATGQSCGASGAGSSLVCVTDTCVKASCAAGQAGCPCKADGSCNEGVCARGFCVAQDSVRAPEAPVCYSPCTTGATLADGSYVPCPADGLMPRCLDGKTCVAGSCVAPSASGPTCTQEVDCPDFQTCIEGGCYSNCSSNAECSAGRKCYRHVCRTTCEASAESCPTGTACVTTDGDTGFCLPIRLSQAAAAPPLAGTFAVSTETFSFSNTRLGGSIVVTNDAPIGLEFTVRKVDHVEFTASGPVTVQTAPLAWLALGAGSTAPQRVQELKVFVDGNGGTARVDLASAANPDLARWEGRLEIGNARLGTRTIFLTYASRPEGRWTGKMHYFASFGDAGLDGWIANRDDPGSLAAVGNAFIQRWGALRQGRIPFDDFEAAVTATVTGSWAWALVRERCEGVAQACYLYHRPPGIAAYSDSLEAYPIPSAGSELPVALNLRASEADPRALVGKIVSAESLQYAGDPAVTLAFADSPSTCSGSVASACLAPLQSLDARIRIGGRYVATSTDTACSRAPAGTFRHERIPWLVPGFAEGTELDASSGLRHRFECRDTQLPFGGGSEALNASLAQSNPVPDARPRVRRLELVDGALVNQETLFIIFRERFEESFLGPNDAEGFSAYGFMTLTRSPAELDASAYEGHAPADARPPAQGVLDTACSPDVVQTVLGPGAVVSDANAAALARVVLHGVAPDATSAELTAASAEKVHYLCHDTGLFDGGASDVDGLDLKVACPIGSNVTFFTSTMDRATIAGEACQRSGSCQETLDRWQANGSYGLRLHPVWRCAAPNQVFCDENRLDLRAEKVFYQAGSRSVVYVPLLSAIDAAFRYKTRFQSRTGATLGFAPEICVENSSAIPYCYDPPAIEEARARVDCALDLYTRRSAAMDPETVNDLRSFLSMAFGYAQDLSGPEPIVRDGFEKLNAELLIMLGDEAYTRAFASRFDLAGSRMLSFEGSRFEPNGIDLAGGAGNEMYNLYKAAQYYGMALDRFYAASPLLWTSLRGDISRNFVGVETVVGYFDRLIRASTQRSRAWSEIAKRYQSFNRPDLARRVAERAYAAAYLESIVLSRLMLGVVNVADPAKRDLIGKRAELAALGYRAALLDMREVYARIKDEPTYFGHAPDFIPFPALEPGDVNAFTKLLAGAKASAAAAARKEETALASTRAFDTDFAQFQAELVRLRNNYENQLAELCGTFLGDDGVVHPAIRAYGVLGEVGRLLGDPCGYVGNGKLHAAIGGLEILEVEMKKVARRYDRVFEEIGIELDRVNAQCSLTLALADYRWTQSGRQNDLQRAITDARNRQARIGRQVQKIENLAQLLNCVNGPAGTSCIGAAVGAVMVQTAYAVTDILNEQLEDEIADAEASIAELQRETARWETLHQCDVMRTDSDAQVKRLLLDLKEIDLDALKTQHQLRLALAEIEQLRNQATRLQAEQEEMQQQTINVEAARNDPNVRIYKNDAVILADKTFQLAVRHAYEATKVFEYYTSQSYAKLGELFLVRMVAHGDYNLEAYLAELETAYRDFQQQYGNPDTRVEIVSLRDDVLAVPRLDAAGRALTQSERIALFREQLGSATWIDERGYVAVPFATTLARLSPLTRNHKVLAVEAEVIGSDVGDTLGRVYLRQRGTGMVLSVDGARSYYLLPERTAVVNPFFNGVRVFGSEVYRSDRMRDRPFVNTHWELVLNQKDERANQDIDLQSLTDLRLYVYYTDFTRL